MAQESNPFYVEPLGGFGAQIGQNIGGIAQGFRKRQELEAQQTQQQAAAQEILDAVASGDPKRVQQVMLQYPQLAEQARGAFEFANEQTEGQVKDLTAQLMYVNDPQAAADLIDQYLPQISNAGGSPMNLALAAKGLREGTQTLEEVKGAAMLLNPEMAKTFQESLSTGKGKETANITDYNYYQKLLKEDPVKAEQFARQTGINKGPEPDLKPTVAMQNYERWQQMPEGAERTAFGRMIGINPKDTPAEARKKLEAAEAASKEIENAGQTIEMVDSFLSKPEYLNAVTGVRGATPFAVPGGTGYDAMVAFEQLKNSLTLDNLSKMTGVLTDRDIQVLSSAASGMQPGMSEKAMKSRLKKIKEVLQSKTARQREKLKELGFGQDEEKPISEMTDEELMKSIFGSK